MRLRRRLVLLTLVLAAAIGGADAARAQWSPPFDISAPAAGTEPQVVVDAAGNATVVWEGDNGTNLTVRARQISAGGVAGPILDISDPTDTGRDGQVELDAAGNAVIVWTGTDATEPIIEARRLSATGTLGPVHALSVVGEDGREPKLAVDPAGNATVIWQRPDTTSYVIEGRRITADETLSPIGALSADGALPTNFDVAVDAAGHAWAAWSQTGLIQARRIAANGALGPTVDLSVDPAATRPRLVLDAAGLPTAVWQLADGRLQFRQALAGGGMGAIIELAPADSFRPDAAIDPSGTISVAYVHFDGSNQRVQLRRIGPSGTLGEIEDLWAGGDDDPPRVGVDADGNATVLWVNFDDAGAPAVRSRAVTAAGEVGPPVDLSSPGEEELVEPALATDAAGDSIAAWVRYDDPSYFVAGARFTIPEPPPPPPPPPVDPSPAPAAPAPPVAAPTCVPATLRRLGGGQGASKGKRVKGVAARLTLDRPARVDVLSATVRYRVDGKRRSARLRARDLDTAGGATLRLRLPAALARSLALGRRVTLELRARARGTGCPYGEPRTLTVRTKVVRVSRT